MGSDDTHGSELDILRAQVNQLLRTESRLYHTEAALHRQLRVFERLHRLSLQLAELGDLGKLGHAVAEFATSVLRYDAAVVWFAAADEGFGVTGFDGFAGDRVRVIRNIALPSSHPLLARTVGGQSVEYPTTTEAELAGLASELGLSHFVAHALLDARGQVNGMLLAGHPNASYERDEVSKQGLANLATQVSALLAATLHRMALERERVLLEARVVERTSELSAALDQVTRLSRTDPLTGIPNRRALLEQCDEALRMARRHSRVLALVVVDVDRFKQVNDTLGHQVGDEVLVAMAHALARSVRETDHVGRLGGEEFVILLPETTATAAVVVAERCRESIRALGLRHLPEQITASFGISVYPEHGDSLDILLVRADQAMYAAKHRGRDAIVVFEPPQP